MVKVYSTLNPRNLRDPRNFEWMRNLHGVLYNIKWIMFPEILDIVLGPSKRGGSNTKLRIVASN